MPDSIINRVNEWGNKTKRDIYDDVIDFKDRRKNLYHCDYEDDLDGLLEQPKPHETDSIPSKFPRVYFDEDGADGTVTDKEVSNDKTMADGSSANSSNVHETFYTDGMEGISPTLLADDDNDIKDVDIP